MLKKIYRGGVAPAAPAARVIAAVMVRHRVIMRKVPCLQAAGAKASKDGDNEQDSA